MSAFLPDWFSGAAAVEQDPVAEAVEGAEFFELFSPG
jgi:hypothetical protein